MSKKVFRIVVGISLVLVCCNLQTIVALIIGSPYPQPEESWKCDAAFAGGDIIHISQMYIYLSTPDGIYATSIKDEFSLGQPLQSHLIGVYLRPGESKTVTLRNMWLFNSENFFPTSQFRSFDLKITVADNWRGPSNTGINCEILYR